MFSFKNRETATVPHYLLQAKWSGHTPFMQHLTIVFTIITINFSKGFFSWKKNPGYQNI